MTTDGTLVDEVDQKMLELLQSDPRMSNKQIAQVTRLSETTVGNRLERMSAQNIARVIGQSDYKTRGWTTTAMLDVTLGSISDESVIARLNELDNVITIYEMAGPPQLSIKVAATDLQDLSRLALETIGKDPDVERVEVNLSLSYGHVRAGFGNLDAPHHDPMGVNGDLQSRILALLAQDGRTSNREMARTLGVAEVTVRNRTKGLLESGLLRYLLIRNPGKAGFAALAFAKFAIRPADLEQSIDRLTAHPNIFGTTVHTGSQNLLVSIYAGDWHEVHVLFDEICSFLPFLEKPVLRPAKRFARHRYEFASIS